MNELIEYVKAKNGDTVGMVKAAIRKDNKVAIGYASIKPGSPDVWDERIGNLKADARIAHAEKWQKDPRTDNIFRKMKMKNPEMYGAIHQMYDRATRYFQKPGGEMIRKIVGLLPEKKSKTATKAKAKTNKAKKNYA